MATRQQSTAFITTRKASVTWQSKIGRWNFDLMRICNYTIDAQDKRDMWRLHPDIAFDWKKIAKQLT